MDTHINILICYFYTVFYLLFFFNDHSSFQNNKLNFCKYFIIMTIFMRIIYIDKVSKITSLYYIIYRKNPIYKKIELLTLQHSLLK